MKKCPYCAEKIQDEAVVCRYCGKELPKAKTPPPATRSQLNFRKFLLPALAVLGVLILAAGAFFLLRQKAAATSDRPLLYALNFENKAAFAGWHVGAPGQYEWLKNTQNGKYLFEYPSGFLKSQDFDFGDAQIAVDVEFLVKNRLAARCVGDQLALLVNDVELGSARDGTFVSGSLSLGYAAETAGAGTFDNLRIFSIYNQDLGTADVDIALLANIHTAGNIGLICRYSEAGWYQFAFDPGGWAIRLAKYDEDGQLHFRLLSHGGYPWTAGVYTKTMRAECKSDRLTMYIDNIKYASIHDQTFPTGKVGLLGWGFSHYRRNWDGHEGW